MTNDELELQNFYPSSFILYPFSQSTISKDWQSVVCRWGSGFLLLQWQF
ncbi:hypothetical protein K9N68_06095 [Kovacikia minuta CCNUW1]|nr:hypothetical protein [Kovacikia minuta]UBF27510.1 hypothetical protein K9N68_06095 [Kovacikia minuta CCNUW1]